MKAERRHELQTNELADWLGAKLEKHRVHLQTLLFVAAVVLAAILFMGFWSGRSTVSQAKAWEDLYLANEPEDLRRIAEQYAGTDVALWARLDLADAYSSEGKRKLDSDREAGMARLREAQQIYADVLEKARPLAEGIRRDIVRRAAIPEAITWELMGDREKALSLYRAIASEFAGQRAVSEEASRRAAELEKPEAADFYKWLAEHKPSTPPPVRSPFEDDMFPPSSDGTDELKTPATRPEPADSEPAPRADSPPDPEKPGEPDPKERPAQKGGETDVPQPKNQTEPTPEPEPEP